MKSSVEKVSPLVRKLSVEVPAQVVVNSFKAAWTEVQKSAALKGFRQGKAPMSALRPLYTDRVKQEVVQDLIRKHYYEALVANKLEPINYPNFEFDAPAEDKDFNFSASIEVRPDITLKKYEGLEVQKEKFKFDESRVDQVLENIRASKAEMVDVLEDRGAIVGDVAIVDFEGFVNGAPLENGKGEGHQLELGSKQFIEGFEEGIVGMKTGGHKTLSLKFPEAYHAKDVAGQPVEFKVTLKALKKKELPALTDEFLKSIGGQDTVESLRTKVREDLEGSEKKKLEGDFRNRLLKALVDANPVEVPPSMLAEQKQILIDDLKNRMISEGLTEVEFQSYLEKWEKDFEATAAQMIQAGFLVDTIAKKHSLESSPADFEQKLEVYVKQTGIEIARIREFYSRPDQAKKLEYMITEEKVIEYLMKSAKIKEVEKASE